MNARVYDQITERIITLLAQGTVPWHKPWKARTGLPRNLVTKKPYRGVNVFLLLTMSYESPFWLTFRQARFVASSTSTTLSDWSADPMCPLALPTF